MPPITAPTRARRFHLDKRADQIIAKCDGADDGLISARELAAWLSVSEQWLDNGRSQGYGPEIIRVGR